jgi:16S rRNA (uracil1498-N3)-methyltransferase
MLKGQRFEWILQKGTELGVSTFVPIETRRTVARPSARWDHKRSRWERIVREAAEQSGRGRLPRLADPIPFAEACREAATCDLALIPWEGQGGVPRTTGPTRTTDAATAASPRREGQGLAGVLRASDVSPQSVALLIGPEGGLEEEEIDLARRTGLRAVTLGPRILRAETAALAAATIVLSELGEMQ